MARNHSNVANPDPARSQFLTGLADSCVKCGLCLPHCPTFQLGHEEAESPRGRIGLVQGLLAGRLTPGNALTTHLEQCLACRNCETVCPARVRYGRLLDGARAELVRRGRRPRPAERLLIALADSRRLQGLADRLLAVARNTGRRRRLSGVLPRRLARLIRMLPERDGRLRLRTRYPAHGEKRGTLALFTGCLGKLTEPEALSDSILVLTHCGYDVVVPPEQACCGALALHAGFPERAQRLIDRNLAVFGALAPDAVVFTASGCGATLREYDELSDHPGAKTFAAMTHDVSHVVSQSGWKAPVRLTGSRVVIHEPCTMRNIVGEQAGSAELLAAVTGRAASSLGDNETCCGSAGAHLATYPEKADRLLAKKLTLIAAARADVVATSNVGCALHLRGGLRRDRAVCEVVHPISLAARSLRAAAGDPGVDL